MGLANSVPRGSANGFRLVICRAAAALVVLSPYAVLAEIGPALTGLIRTRILLDQDILDGKHTFDDFAFEVDEHGKLELTDDGREIIEEALFLAATGEARGLPGYRGSGS
jgi:hypothetical protein